MSVLRLRDGGGACVTVESTTSLVADTALNHGLTMSTDGTTVFASTQDVAYAWTYDAAARTVSNRRTIITGMNNGGHTTRTLHYTSQSGGQLIAVRGSDGNIDLQAGTQSTGRCHLRAFPLASVPSNGHTFTSSGKLLGWGLRNSVGIHEHPGTGEIWTVENSMDNLMRQGRDIHQNNPGEELNRHGTVSGSTGANYGYPYCVTAWNAGEVGGSGITTGTAFAADVSSGQRDDAYCQGTQAPRLTFPAHTAPLDFKFNTSTEAFISFHGSW
jgi:glucose/arabinose dehydrogenase